MDDTFALMKGCADEALSSMIAGRRRRQRKSEGCTDDTLTLVHTMQNQLMFINRASFTTSSMEMIWITNRKVACRCFTQVEVVIDEEVT